MSYHNHNEQTSSKGWGSAQLSDTEKFTGYMSSKDQYNSNNVEQIRSQVGSLNGNVNIIAANNLNIIAKDITVLDDANHGSAHQSSKDLKIGNFTKISSPLIDLANAVDTLNQSKADDCTKALQTMAALGQGYTAYSAGKNIQDASLIKIESGIGFKSSYRQSQANQLTAKDSINLNSARDIILEADNNQHKADGKNSSAGLSVGVGASIGAQTGVYIYGEAGFSSGNNHLNAQTHSQTTLQSDKLSLTSKGNTTLIGAQANANRIDANIGGKLSIISPQDQIDQKISQSGANIHVQGGAIASTAAKEHNQLTTNSLTFTDIENHSSFKASNTSISGGFSGKDSTTHATISPGQITINGQQTSVEELGIHSDIDSARTLSADMAEKSTRSGNRLEKKPSKNYKPTTPSYGRITTSSAKTKNNSSSEKPAKTTAQQTNKPNHGVSVEARAVP